MNHIKIYNKEFLTELEYETSKFPGGEIHVCLAEHIPFIEYEIKAIIQSSDDVMRLLLITDAIKRFGGKKINLTMPYVPYSRQDRVCNEGESLSLKVFCDLINAQNYNSIIIYDPHSDVASALLNNCQIIEQWELIYNIKLNKANTVLVSPDAGALKKTQKVAQKCEFNQVIEASKIRDTKTGKIIDTVIHSGHLLDKDVLVIDDICDGGRTFIELGKKLKQLTGGKLFLYTTHGIYSKGCHELLKYYDHLYTANPWAVNINEDFITILKGK